MSCKQFISLILFFLLSCLGVPSAFSWEETSAANLLVFDNKGEVTATYHLDDWTTEVRKNENVILRQEWKPGSPPQLISEETTPFTVNSDETALPNIINGASSPPPVGTPDVSMYTFDQAFFASTTPKTPGLSVSQPSGNYTTTLALEFTCLPLPGTTALKSAYTIEALEGKDWISYTNPHTVYLAKSEILQVRAVYTTISGSRSITEKLFSYTIKHPADWNRDSDGDGFPDVWEIAHGLNPLSSAADNVRMADSDGDGMSDADELLRNSDPNDPAILPADQDGDDWSDWDEETRGTAVDNDGSFPTATRLYEVEIILSGVFSGGAGSWSSAPYSIETLGGQSLYSHTAKLNGIYGIARIPVGREAFIRAVQPGDTDGDGDTDSEDNFVVAVSRYLPMIPDPSPADVTGDWTTATEWQDLYKQFLTDQLVVTRAGFNVMPGHRAELAALARSLELEASIVPEAWFGFGSFGHKPSLPAIDDLRARLRLDERSINDMVADISSLLDSGCTSFRADISDFANNVPAAGVEAVTASYFQGQAGSYISALLAHYSVAELSKLITLDWPLCELLNPDNDLDNDLLPAYQEISLTIGSSDPFTADSDHDGINDEMDNCPATANPSQKDSDADGQGDICDDDDDNDGLSDGTEMAFGSNPFNTDTDGDGDTDSKEWDKGTHPGVSVYVTQIKSPTNESVQTISGYRYPGAVVYISSIGASAAPVTYPTETSWSSAISNLVEERIYEFGLLATFGGNLGYGTTSISVDLTVPVVVISSPVNGSTVSVDNPVLTFSAEDGTVEVWLDGLLATISSGDTLGPLSNGSHTVTVTATDPAGNSGSYSSTFTVLALPLGDADGDYELTLADSIILLQLLTNISPGVQLTDQYLPATDNRWGMEEIIFIMQEISSQ